MGEFYENRTTQSRFKFATMDDARYVRRDELASRQAQAVDPENIEDFLTDPSSLWRFPYPDEDSATDEQIGKRDMFRTLTIGIRRRTLLWDVTSQEEALRERILNNVQHNSMHRSMYVAGASESTLAAPGINVGLPCPCTLATILAKPRGSTAPIDLDPGATNSIPIQIYGVRFDSAGDERTIFRCGWCEAPFSLDREDIDIMAPLLPAEIVARIKPRPPRASLPKPAKTAKDEETTND